MRRFFALCLLTLSACAQTPAPDPVRERRIAAERRAEELLRGFDQRAAELRAKAESGAANAKDDVRRTNGDVVFKARIGGSEWTSTQVVFPSLPDDEIGTPSIKSWVIKH